MLVALVLRISLLVYGDYHDRHSSLKYTDVDYRVFSDASRFIAHASPDNLARGFMARMLLWNLGEYVFYDYFFAFCLNLALSPYTRATYRYTPLLALLILPNELHPMFGKVLFCLCDLLVGLLLYYIFLRIGIPSPSAKPGSQASKEASFAMSLQHRAILWISGLWLLNPMVANISTRGSAESVLGAMVVTTHYLILSDRLNSAATMFGLSVHFKIYPIIYGVSTLAWIDHQNPIRFSWTSLTRRRVQFALISVLSFFVLGVVMFAM